MDRVIWVLADIVSEQACTEMVITGLYRPCAISSVVGKCSRESDGGPGAHVRWVCTPSDDLALAGSAGSRLRDPLMFFVKLIV